MKLWGYRVDPSAEQLKEIADSLIVLRRNNYQTNIFDDLDNTEDDKLKKLQKAMIDWRLNSAESSEVSHDEAKAVLFEMENSLNWWRDNGKSFNPDTSPTLNC